LGGAFPVVKLLVVKMKTLESFALNMFDKMMEQGGISDNKTVNPADPTLVTTKLCYIRFDHGFSGQDRPDVFIEEYNDYESDMSTCYYKVIMTSSWGTEIRVTPMKIEHFEVDDDSTDFLITEDKSSNIFNAYWDDNKWIWEGADLVNKFVIEACEVGTFVMNPKDDYTNFISPNYDMPIYF
jgi:hypothetical protein